ncbi:hypothetical protein MPLDJ20_20262 [Mesorhizobium plurifarium]|uniref:Uncharacterized protein n=1 Tax=Mesorhizobium plurifarium TaxID=69974 RepID=A0A090EVF8_MESPL|nr:hypothetical protein MPLDJ20_20262 [Mesorhizobium plurifarium]
MTGLVECARAYSADRDERQSLTSGARAGSPNWLFAHGGNEEWRALLDFSYRARGRDLLGDCLDDMAAASGREGEAPNERFWSAWQPAADWLLEQCILRGRDRAGDISQALLAAGLVGPNTTPKRTRQPDRRIGERVEAEV